VWWSRSASHLEKFCVRLRAGLSVYVFLDVDDTIIEVHRHQKQGSSRDVSENSAKSPSEAARYAMGSVF
jgi:hypothetical protein